MPSETYNVGCYLLDRLAETGCGHLFGVPGDYNLRFLDDVEASNVKWVGCANELNAAYAADGYSRIRHMGAILTTYGVGELSALNGVAGAYAERVPVLHIVGGPSRAAENNHLMMHHTLADGNFKHFSTMSEQISCATAHLTPTNAASEIDRVINTILEDKRPGYILLPMDVAVAPIAAPICPLQRRVPEVSQEALAAFTARVEEMLSKARAPAALIGYTCDRYLCHKEAQALVDDAHIPFAHMLLGKDTLNEQSRNYIGCYFGATSPDSVRRIIEDADVLVRVGVKFHDFGTGYFSQKVDDERSVIIGPFACCIGTQTYAQVPMAVALETVRSVALKYCSAWPTDHPAPEPIARPKDPKVWCAHHFWHEVQANLKPGDIIVVDQGTSSSACAGLIMPENTNVLVQCLWGSIGYSIPAAFGAQMADPSRRVILSVGDGSAQMTAQELGSFLRHDLHPVIFLVNNDGYVIERVIHGWNAAYNDIAPWNWCDLIKAVSGPKTPTTSVVSEIGKVAEILKSTETDRKTLTYTEVILGRHELPVVSLAWKPS